MKNLNKMKIAPDMQYEIGQDKRGYFPTWDVKDDETLWAKVNKLAHSTFDLSKFTVVGSPNITDDGIASGFSSSNYLYSSINIKPSNKFHIKCIFKTNNKYTAITIFTFNDGNSNPISNFSLALDNSEYNNVYFRYRKSGTWVNYNLAGFGFSANTEYNVEVIYDGTNLKLYIDGIERANVNDFEFFNSADIERVYFGSFANNNNLGDGTIDLKQFSITVDGVLIFSGNRTGIDTIKPDDYTVVGTPTISADGVASGFNLTNALTQNISIASGSNVIINLDVTNGEWASGQYQMPLQLCASDNTPILTISRYATKLQVESSESPANTLITNSSAKITLDTDLATYVKCYVNSVLVIDTTFSNSVNVAKVSIGNHITPEGWKSWAGSIDLNAFKIYVDGNLVYQPCLKIPYTEAINYNKSVNSIYQDRVRDAFEQRSYNAYYVNNEVEKKFVLPTCNFDDIIYHKEIGTTVANQDADSNLSQQGICEAGTAVTLPVEYRDDTYTLSVATSAKTAEGFTPTESGIWQAYGKAVE